MNVDDGIEAVLAAREAFGDLLTTAPTDLDADSLDDVIVLWSELRGLANDVYVMVRELGTLIADEMDLEHRDEYEHPKVGPLYTDRARNERWNGAAVLAALCKPMVDPEVGEFEPAVPVGVLAKVLPAVGEGQTSSKWKKSGLRAVGLDPDDYVTTEWQRAQVRPGRKPNR